MRHHKYRKLVLPLLLAALMLDLSLAIPQNGANRPTAAPTASAKPKPETQPAAQQGETRSPEDDRVILEWADDLRHNPETQMHYFRGNVVFANKDMKLYSDAADYNEANSTAKATGHLRMIDPNSVITGDLIEADFDQEIAIVTGNVTIVTQKKPNPIKDGEQTDTARNRAAKSPTAANGADGRNQPAEPPQGNLASKDEAGRDPERVEDYWEKKTVITCERLEYYYGDNEKRMILTPRVKAVQEDKTVWADKGVYEDIPRLITLTGNVIVQTTGGDEMRCAKAVVSVDEDWIQAQGASGMTLRKGKNDSEAGGATATPAPSPSSGGSPAPPPPIATPSPASGSE